LLVRDRRGSLRQSAISANDTKLKLVDGKAEVQKGTPADTVTVIDMRVTPPKVLAELNVPNSVVGPPTNVAIGPKEDIALVSSNMMIDPADPTKQIPDDKVTVIDLTPLKPSIVGRLKTAVGVKGSAAAPTVLATLQGRQGARRHRHQQGRHHWRWWPTGPKGRFRYSRSTARR
jgi:hypothetical protein